MGCKWYSVCPLRRLEKEVSLKGSWREEYCASADNWLTCRRYQLEEEGICHADNMLPDGSSDESLAVDSR